MCFLLGNSERLGWVFSPKLTLELDITSIYQKTDQCYCFQHDSDHQLLACLQQYKKLPRSFKL